MEEQGQSTFVAAAAAAAAAPGLPFFTLQVLWPMDGGF